MALTRVDAIAADKAAGWPFEGIVARETARVARELGGHEQAHHGRACFHIPKRLRICPK